MCLSLDHAHQTLISSCAGAVRGIATGSGCCLRLGVVVKREKLGGGGILA